MVVRRLGTRQDDDGVEALTGCLTPRGLEREAPGIRRLAGRSETSVAVVTVDLVGAASGVAPPGRAPADEADVDTGLALVADVLRVSVRTRDRVARTAPRRFAVLLAGELGYVLDTAERLHRGTRRGLRRLGLAPRVGLALRSPRRCEGPAQEWVGGLVDEAAGATRFG